MISGSSSELEPCLGSAHKKTDGERNHFSSHQSVTLNGTSCKVPVYQQSALVVCLHSVLRQVQTFQLVFFRYSQLSDYLQDCEENEHGDKGINRNHN